MPKPSTRAHYLTPSAKPPFDVGTPVVILRPCLWAGCSGTVEKYDAKTTIHTIAINGKHGETFRGEATADCLEIDL